MLLEAQESACTTYGRRPVRQRLPCRRSGGALGPWLDLASRLWPAQAFLAVLVRGMMAAPSGGRSAPLGPSCWLGALHGLVESGPGAVVQAACPLLLAVGLLCRAVALAMPAQAVLLPMAGPTPDGRLFWTAVLVRILLLGPGALSLDSLARRGADSSALSGARWAGRLHAWLLHWGNLLYLLGLRLWLAPAGIALAALGMTDAMRPGALAWLPQVRPMVAGLAPWAALGCWPAAAPVG